MIGRVEPAAVLADSRGGLDRLGAGDRGGRRGLAAGDGAALAAQLVVHGLGRTGFVRAVQHVVDGRPGRKPAGIARQRMPSLTR